jgi:chromosome segregation ATPase
MEESHYRALLEEVRSDVTNAEQAIEDANQAIADAEQTIEELATLETYLLSKVDGGEAAPRASRAKPSGSRSSSRAARKPEPAKGKENSGAAGKGMQTVEFGPDGFPST